ncbi:MAG: metG [Parcubacteria group bacterium]|nr:metG [Parcubacteria group bacterium]
MEKKSFYITTTLPYVNSDPHIGFAMEIIRADTIARWKKLSGFEVFFNTGTDEHGQKIWQKALEAEKDVQAYVDEYAEKFKDLIPLLGISPDIHFIRTTDEKHVRAAQEFWKRVDAKGDIYKKEYSIKYCVGCELEKTDSEVENGHCILHPHLELEIREEENYFFRFSKYQKLLLDLYAANPEFVIPDFRFNEIKAFVERGLEDFSISRLASKMPWGVLVPGDEAHVMYVWFDALVSYISTLDWPDAGRFEMFWKEGTPVQYAGKDNLRQQSAMWQAMLMSAGLPQSNTIVINGFINSGGQKMSKSLGNVISPTEAVEKYGVEALRYFVLRELSTFEDSDFTWERMNEAYNSGLANGVGNLTSRIMKLAETYLEGPVQIKPETDPELGACMEKFEHQKAMNRIWAKIADLDVFIQTEKPWETKDIQTITSLVERLGRIAHDLAPFLPDTSEKIIRAIEAGKLEAGLFPRK